MRGRFDRFVLAALIAGLAACDSTTAPPQATIEIVSGADQSGGAGQSLPQPVVVRVLVGGQPARGAEVHWAAIAGGGVPSETITKSDDSGLASVAWTMGADLGPQLLSATSGNGSISIRANSIFAIRSVTAGFHHFCALSTAGVAYCWGANGQGQLGIIHQNDTNTPTRVVTPVRFLKVSAGWSHTCGLSTNHAIYCWGDNSVGQLGVPGITRSAAPVLVSDREYIDVSVGFVHSCAVAKDGVVSCWGSNGNGQLGAGTISGMQQVSAGEFHTCGVRNDGTVLCWGWNSFGELGSSTAFGTIRATPAPVTGNQKYSYVSAGVRHTCAVETTGRVFCWGLNGSGETGRDIFNHVGEPVAVNGADGFSFVEIANSHTCGLRAGRAYCWGLLPGDGTTTATKTPTLVNGPAFSAIDTGYENTCAVSNGELWCWDLNAPTPRKMAINP